MARELRIAQCGGHTGGHPIPDGSLRADAHSVAAPPSLEDALRANAAKVNVPTREQAITAAFSPTPVTGAAPTKITTPDPNTVPSPCLTAAILIAKAMGR